MKKLTFIVLLNFLGNITASPRPSEPRIIPSLFSLPELQSAYANDPLMRPFFASISVESSDHVDDTGAQPVPSLHNPNVQLSDDTQNTEVWFFAPSDNLNVSQNRRARQNTEVQRFAPSDNLIASPGQRNFSNSQENLQPIIYSPVRLSSQSTSRTPIDSQSSTPIARTFTQRREREDDDSSHINSRTQPSLDAQLIRELTQQRNRQNLAELSRVRRAHYVSPVPPPFSIGLQNSRTITRTEVQTDSRQSQETMSGQSTNHENITIRPQSVNRELFGHIDQ